MKQSGHMAMLVHMSDQVSPQQQALCFEVDFHLWLQRDEVHGERSRHEYVACQLYHFRQVSLIAQPSLDE